MIGVGLSRAHLFWLEESLYLSLRLVSFKVGPMLSIYVWIVGRLFVLVLMKLDATELRVNYVRIS